MQTPAPLLSIGLPVFNGEDYLREALDSILAQTFTDFELILADNGSTDQTLSILQAYQARDVRIHILTAAQNRGATWNFNRTVDAARGKYFKWAAHDDLLAPTYLEKCIEAIESQPAAVLVYPHNRIINEHGEAKEEYADELDLRDASPAKRFWRFHLIYRKPHLCNPVFGVMRTEVLRKTNRIGNFVSSDVHLLGEIALHGQLHEIPEVLFFRRDHARTSVRANAAYRDRIAWFDPQKRGKLELTHWRWLLEYMRMVSRAPLSAIERIRCTSILLFWVGWHGHGLAKDIAKIAAWPLLKPFLANKRQFPVSSTG